MRFAFIAAFAFAALAAVTVSGQTPTRDEAFGPDLHIREFRIPTADTPSLTLFLREKYLTNGSNGVGLANKTVLFVAGGEVFLCVAIAIAVAAC